MTIDTLRLVNFRNFDDATFELSGRTFLTGENGAGKSTVIDGISWALRGICRGTDARGAGSKDLIRLGTDAASVTISLTDAGGQPFTVTRTVARNGGGGCTMKQDAILSRLGAGDAAIESVLYGRTFFALHHKAAKDLLLKVLDVRIPVADLPGASLDPAVVDVDLDTLDLLYAGAFDARAAAKKVLASVVIQDLPTIVGLEHEPTLLKAHADKARANERNAAADLASKLAELHSTVQARQKCKPVNADELKGKADVHRTMLQEERQKEADAATTLTDLESQAGLSAGEFGAKISQRQSLILKIEAHDPDRGCILDPSIPCGTDAKAFKGQIKDLKAQVKALTADAKKVEALTRDTIQAAQAKNDATKAAAYHQNQLAQIDTALDAADDTDAMIVQLDRDVERLTVDVDQASADKADAIQLSTQAADLATAAVAYQAALKARQASEDKRGRYQAEVDRLEALVTVLGPKGVRATALQNALTDFEAAINGGLAGFGFCLAFTVEPWTVQVSRDGGGAWQQFDLLSDGEKLWTGACFQQALALIAGLNFVAIDNAETTVGAKRAMLTRLIMLSPVGQIVVAKAAAATDPLPDIDGLTVIPIFTPDATRTAG
jgi:DNA repair exonuclease SbcCD ATPase subunit